MKIKKVREKGIWEVKLSPKALRILFRAFGIELPQEIAIVLADTSVITLGSYSCPLVFVVVSVQVRDKIFAIDDHFAQNIIVKQIVRRNFIFLNLARKFARPIMLYLTILLR